MRQRANAKRIYEKDKEKIIARVRANQRRNQDIEQLERLRSNCSDGARRKSPEPAPAPPAMSPRDTRDSAQYRASNQTQPGQGYRDHARQFDRESSGQLYPTTPVYPLGW